MTISIRRISCFVIGTVVILVGTASAQQPRAEKPPQRHVVTANDAKVIAEFKAKVDAYDALRKDLAKKAPPLKKTDDPAEIALAEKALAQQIRLARANARPGDIFTPETQRVFKRLLNPTLKGDEGVENKTVLKEDRPPASKISFQVNGEYPKDQPLSTVPPDLLQALPPLPDAVQYRFAGKHLILYCTRGNLIVDYMLNAIP
jgi:hypothetical protein